jgi:hypothetical protein
MDDRSPSFTSTFSNLLRLNRGKLAVAILIALLGVFFGAPQPQCAVACKPVIAIKEVQTSGVQDLQRVWTAVLAVNGANCATSSGRFEIDFIRAKETAPDMQFTEQFEWKAGETKISLDLWRDEVITDYRIGFIAPCVCRELKF